MPRKRPASQPASQRMTAAELQRLHGGLLASAPYVDLSPYRLVKALAEQGIIIPEPLDVGQQVSHSCGRGEDGVRG